jgi:hypothetical protein
VGLGRAVRQHDRNDTGHLDLIRNWFGRPLWEMRPEDADAYFGRVLRDARPSTRTGRAAALTVNFQFLKGNFQRSYLTCGNSDLPEVCRSRPLRFVRFARWPGMSNSRRARAFCPIATCRPDRA